MKTKITFVSPDGNEKTVQAENGLSLMVAAKDNNIDKMKAICNGCCSCGTCVVYLDGSTELAKLSPQFSGERQVLDKVKGLPNNARLACQVIVSKDLNGMRFFIKP